MKRKPKKKAAKKLQADPKLGPGKTVLPIQLQSPPSSLKQHMPVSRLVTLFVLYSVSFLCMLSLCGVYYVWDIVMEFIITSLNICCISGLKIKIRSCRQ